MLHLLFLVPAAAVRRLRRAGAGRPAPVARRRGRRGRRLGGPGGAWWRIAVSIDFIASPPAGHAFDQVLWTWLSVAGLKVQVALYLDPLAVCFILIVTCVGFLIHLYSVEHMAEDDGYARFFTYMNLFVGSMLVLVLADNLLLLYLGWEGVGLCSYLLIGFWYKHWYNGYAARKAFVVTRVGDTALIVGLFLLFTQLGTLQIQPLMTQGGGGLAAGLRPAGGRRPAAAGRRPGQVGPAPPADLAARRHGRPLAGQRPDPRGHHGHRRRLPDRPHQRALRPGAVGAHDRGHHRRRDAALRRRQRPVPGRPQAHPRLLDDQPGRLHVPRPGRGRLVGRRLPCSSPTPSSRRCCSCRPAS